MTRSSRLGSATVVGAALVLTTMVGRLGTAVAAQDDVTFTRDVAPILYENCVSCHRPGELAPMALRSYAEVRPWARGIKDKAMLPGPLLICFLMENADGLVTLTRMPPVVGRS